MRFEINRERLFSGVYFAVYSVLALEQASCLDIQQTINLEFHQGFEGPGKIYSPNPNPAAGVGKAAQGGDFLPDL